ncbi:hypothetical protein A9Q83_17195 [Alphaproteobacteria bacterium 46_93_T64]|nr:hypothetical protein A9Q83_17195 [Alphaproteobacteria bacterium 46_93_T64]
MGKWLAEKDWDYFVTLATNKSPNSLHNDSLVSWANKQLHNWHARMDRKFLGPKWQNKKDQRIEFVAFLEHADSNIHWHLMVKLHAPKHDIFESEASATWLSIVPSGSVITKCANKDDTANATFCGYSSKDARPDRPADYIVFSHR